MRHKNCVAQFVSPSPCAASCSTDNQRDGYGSFLRAHLIDEQSEGNPRGRNKSHVIDRPKGATISHFRALLKVALGRTTFPKSYSFATFTMRLFRTTALQEGCAIFLVLAFSTLVSAIDVNVCSSFNTAETPLSKFGSSATREITHLTFCRRQHIPDERALHALVCTEELRLRHHSAELVLVLQLLSRQGLDSRRQGVQLALPCLA